MDQFLKRDHG